MISPRIHCLAGLVVLFCVGQQARPQETKPVEPKTNPKTAPDDLPPLTTNDSAPAAIPWTWQQSPRAVFAPNMYGDIIGNRLIQGFRTIAGTPAIPGMPGTAATAGTVGTSRQLTGFVIFDSDGSTSNVPFIGTSGSSLLENVSEGPNLYNGQVITRVDHNATSPLVGLPSRVSLLENPTTTQDITNLFANPGETVTFNQGASFAVLEFGSIYNVFLVYDLTTPGTPGDPGTPETPGTAARLVAIAMPNPVGGGLIGRTKVSTGNSIVPRDRVIFDYDAIANAPVRLGGRDVHRFAPGFEKTFLDGAGSVIVRLPFASAANPIAGDGITNGPTTLFGNVFVQLHGLAYSGNVVTVAGGLGISIPTADDTRFRVGGADLLRIRNDTVLLTPYLGVLFTPTDRWFAQAWTAVEFDTRGNPVQANTGTGLATIGRLNDPALLQLDYQLGYWFIHPALNPRPYFRGLATFAELHYNRSLTGHDSIYAGDVAVVDSLARYSELNLSAGVTAQIGGNLLFTTGVTAPLNNGNNRFGDYQVGFRLNWMFGPTAANRSIAPLGF